MMKRHRVLLARVLHATGLVRLYERRFDRIVATLLHEQDGTFVDVGVHLAEFLVKVKAIRPDVPYVGFEPDPECCALARRIVRSRGFRDCRVVPIGLSDRRTIVRLFRTGQADPHASIVEGFRVPGFYDAQDPVAVLDGDHALESMAVGTVTVVKIDVEGAELEIVRGLGGTIDRDRPYLLCEVLPSYEGSDAIARFRQRRQTELERLLRDAGYDSYRVSADGILESIGAIGFHSDPTRCEYLFAPHESRDSLAVLVGRQDRAKTEGPGA